MAQYIYTMKDLRKITPQGKEILRGIWLAFYYGAKIGVLGANGSGKSTLALVLSGREGYDVTEGEILYNEKDVLQLSPDERACEGIFMAFQYPVEIPGVTTNHFLKASLNAVRRYRGLDEIDAMDMLTLIKEKMELVEMDERLLTRLQRIRFHRIDLSRHFRRARVKLHSRAAPEPDSVLRQPVGHEQPKPAGEPCCGLEIAGHGDRMAALDLVMVPLPDVDRGALSGHELLNRLSIDFDPSNPPGSTGRQQHDVVADHCRAGHRAIVKPQCCGP